MKTTNAQFKSEGLRSGLGSACDKHGHPIPSLETQSYVGKSENLPRWHEPGRSVQLDEAAKDTRQVPRRRRMLSLLIPVWDGSATVGKILRLRRAPVSPFEAGSAHVQLPIHCILVPVDATNTTAAALQPILQLARRLDAAVLLLHCYSPPPCFDYAIGKDALDELEVHRNLVKAQLFKLSADVRKSFPKCSCYFASGSPVSEILQLSENMQADLIAVPLPLDFISHCWTSKELLDELIRRANCPVLVPPGQLTTN